MRRTFRRMAGAKIPIARSGWQVAAAIKLLERVRRSCSMLTLLAALAMSPVATAATDSQLPAAPWWERITVTVSGDGQSQGCLYQSSTGERSSECTVEDAAAATTSSEHSATGGAELTRITYERRFTPGAVTPADFSVQAGDTLLGREVMALAIDGRGSVKACQV